MPKLQPGTIGCNCGKCEIIVADNRAVQYFRCGCEDCRQGIEWGESKKKNKPSICKVMPDQLPHLYYIPADIISIKGKEFMSAYKLREDGKSIRLYCNQCWSLIGVEHPNYKSNVFLIFPKHCKTNCDLSVPLTAIVYMIDYPEDYEPPPEDDVPLFHSRKYKQEQIRWSKISLVAKNFSQRTKPREGISFTELVASLGTPTTLGLEKGKAFV